MSNSGNARPLEGRVALVTGASRGIGLAIAKAFAEAGASVAMVSRGAAELKRSAGTISGKTCVVAADVSEAGAAARVLEQVERELGPVDVLVNNAAVQAPIGLLDEVSEDECRQSVDINLLAPIWLMRAVLPGMKRRKRGSIINLSGGGATSPRERFAMYAATKTALVRLTETLAVELTPFGVRVNAISPGAINTRMTDEVEAAGAKAGSKAAEETRKQRETGGASAENAAELTVFLASDDSSAISGRLISAVWDDWRALRASRQPLATADMYTLRRVSVTSKP